MVGGGRSTVQLAFGDMRQMEVDSSIGSEKSMVTPSVLPVDVMETPVIRGGTRSMA